MKTIRRYIFASIASCLAATAANAQTPPDAGSLLQQQEQAGKALPGTIPEAEPGEEIRPALSAEKGISVEIKSIRFTGAVDLVPESELQAQVADAIGNKLDFAGLQALADKVTAYLRSKGYLLATAYLPRQDVTAGNIEIAILRGRLDGAEGKGGWQINPGKDTRIDPERLSAIAERAAPSGAVLQERELERALLLMNDLPGISARSRLEPGTAPGSSRAVVEVTEGPRYSGNAWADNNGNYSTGEAQINAALDLNDPARRGDHARLSLTASQGITLARLGYDAPLGASGLRGSIGYTAMQYTVKRGSGVASGLKGDSAIAHAGLSYPIIRSRKLNLHVSTGYDKKSLQDDSSAGALRDKQIGVYTLGLSGDSLDQIGGGGLNGWSLQYTRGSLDLSGVAADAASDAASLKTSGSYHKTDWNLSRLQRLSGDFTLSARLGGQIAGKNLDSSEQFILGGPGGVRAYPVGEAQGDQGWLANLDLRYDLPGGTRYGNVQLNAFYDSGSITQHKNPNGIAIATATGENSYRLSGTGLGASVGKPGSYRVGLIWAHVLGDNPGRTVAGENADGKHNRNRYWLQGVIWF